MIVRVGVDVSTGRGVAVSTGRGYLLVRVVGSK